MYYSKYDPCSYSFHKSTVIVTNMQSGDKLLMSGNLIFISADLKLVSNSRQYSSAVVLAIICMGGYALPHVYYDICVHCTQLYDLYEIQLYL